MILQKSMSFNDIAVVTIEENVYKIHFWFLSGSETVNKMKIADLSEKSEQLIMKKIFVIAMSNNTPETMT